MKISDIVYEKVLNNSLFEMAYQRKRVIEKISNFQHQIAIHCVKTMYLDSDSKNHWESELNAWLREINMFKLKNKKKLSGDMYYKLLFDEPLGERVNLQDIINYIFDIEGMEEVPIYEPYSTEDGIIKLHEDLESLLRKVSFDIANNKFKSIKDYDELSQL